MIISMINYIYLKDPCQGAMFVVCCDLDVGGGELGVVCGGLFVA